MVGEELSIRQLDVEFIKVEEKQEFVKTPTQKIRRFLYTKRNPHQKHEMSKR